MTVIRPLNSIPGPISALKFHLSAPIYAYVGFYLRINLRPISTDHAVTVAIFY